MNMMDEMGRIMALDVGAARVGIALSDPLGIIASPEGVVPATPEAAALEQLVRLVREKEARAVVIGLPRLTGGTEGEQARETREFARKLRNALPADIPMYFEDERFTTTMARQVIRQKGGKSRNKGEKDAIAAAHILRTFLDRPPATRQPYQENACGEDDAP